MSNLNEFEIVRSYKNCANHQKQIYILAQLNDCKGAVIRGILAKHGIITQSSEGNTHPWPYEQILRRLYEAGKRDCEIMRETRLSRSSIYDWRLRHGLPANGRKK